MTKHCSAHLLRLVFGESAALVSTLCLAEPRLLHMLVMGGTETLHFVAAVLSRRSRECANDPRAWAQRLAFEKRAHLLAEIFGPLPAGFIGALERCGPSALSAEFYERLHRVMSDQRLGPSVQHRSTITAPFIALLDIAQINLIPTSVLRAADPKKLDEVLALVDLMNDALSERPNLAELLRNAPDVSTFARALAFYLDEPFPTPPWPGDDLLMPVRTPAALSDLAAEMGNCLEQYSDHVRTGRCHIYRTRQHPVAALAIRDEGSNRWYIDQIEVKNERSDGEDAASACAALALQRDIKRRTIAAGIAEESRRDRSYAVRNTCERVFGSFEWTDESGEVVILD